MARLTTQLRRCYSSFNNECFPYVLNIHKYSLVKLTNRENQHVQIGDYVITSGFFHNTPLQIIGFNDVIKKRIQYISEIDGFNYTVHNSRNCKEIIVANFIKRPIFVNSLSVDNYYLQEKIFNNNTHLINNFIEYIRTGKIHSMTLDQFIIERQKVFDLIDSHRLAID